MSARIYEHDIPGGSAWSVALDRHDTLRLEALGDDANVSMLIYAASDPAERLNVPDTLKAQMSARIHPPLVLMSDMGRALASVTGSSLDWHDALTGHSRDDDLDRYPPSSYAVHRNAWRRSARSCLLDELYKHDLDQRDLHATVNWFTKAVPSDDDRATLTYVSGHCHTGDWVTLRAEVPVLAILSTSPHPLAPRDEWAPAPVRAAVGTTLPPGSADPSRTYRDESARALLASERSPR